MKKTELTGEVSSGVFARLYAVDPKTVKQWCEKELIPARFVTTTRGGHRRISLQAAAPEVLTGRQIYIPEQVAELFQVAPATVANWRRDGIIKGFQTPGGHWRYTDEQINTAAISRLGRPIVSYANVRV